MVRFAVTLFCTATAHAGSTPDAAASAACMGISMAFDAAPLPVLMVIANRDFYYQEYADTRASLEGEGVAVVVAAATTRRAIPHGGNPRWLVHVDRALTAVDAADYSAIVFVGGWGSSAYQYAFEGTYANVAYRQDPVVTRSVNELINDFVDQDKYVAAICHGVTVLAWARVDGVSLLAGRQVSVPLTAGSPAQFYDGAWLPDMHLSGQYDQVLDNGGRANTVSGQYGDPGTVADDVVVDGRIITAESRINHLAILMTLTQDTTEVPAPPALLLLGLGLVGAAAAARRARS